MVTLCACLVVVAVRETQPFRRRGKSRYGDAQNLPEQDAALGCGCVLETSKHAPYSFLIVLIILIVLILLLSFSSWLSAKLVSFA
jgi:hypothetical protein